MSDRYVASSYWDEIHKTAHDESAVGYPNLARSLNRARYDVERRNVIRAISAVEVARRPRVLDIGSGTGIWIEFWRELGASEILGVDLASAAVQRLRARYPEHRFEQRDIGEPGISLPTDMDVVSAMSVLLHITDDARFEQAMRNLMTSVAADGILILAEPVVVHRWWGEPFGPHSNSLARPLTAYSRILQAGGFEIVHLRPSTCLLSQVIDTRTRLSFRLLANYWYWLSRLVGRRERVGKAAGAVVRPVDLLLTRFAANGPSVKVLIARRA